MRWLLDASACLGAIVTHLFRSGTSDCLFRPFAVQHERGSFEPSRVLKSHVEHRRRCPEYAATAVAVQRGHSSLSSWPSRLVWSIGFSIVNHAGILNIKIFFVKIKKHTQASVRFGHWLRRTVAQCLFIWLEERYRSLRWSRERNVRSLGAVEPR